MKINTILFDLDGTLLPMDQGAFLKLYFTELCKKCAQHGFEPGAVKNAVWAGTEQMVKNDGSRTNEEVFWQVFATQLGDEALALKPTLELFYENEFHAAKAATGHNPKTVATVHRLKEAGFTLILASNPLFPLRAYATRLRWIGLSPQAFSLITGYEQFHHSKPNPAYFSEILQVAGKRPEECLMVGNDVQEDACAAAAGIPVFITTDHLIDNGTTPNAVYQTGSFDDFVAYMEAEGHL